MIRASRQEAGLGLSFSICAVGAGWGQRGGGCPGPHWAGPRGRNFPRLLTDLWSSVLEAEV